MGKKYSKGRGAYMSDEDRERFDAIIVRDGYGKPIHLQRAMIEFFEKTTPKKRKAILQELEAT